MTKPDFGAEGYSLLTILPVSVRGEEIEKASLILSEYLGRMFCIGVESARNESAKKECEK